MFCWVTLHLDLQPFFIIFLLTFQELSSVAKGLDKQKGYKATSKYKKMIVPFLTDLTLLSISCGNPSVEATMNFESFSALLFSATDLTLMQSVSIDLTLVQSVSVGKSAERKYH